MNLKLLSTLAAGLITTQATVNAASLVIDSVVSQTIGSTAIVNPSGSTDNTNTWNVGVVGEFILKDASDNFYGLRVSASAPSGALAAGTDSLMVARTVDSQGLTDAGTLSVYVQRTGLLPDPPTPQEWSLDLNFSFYTVTGGTTITSTPLSIGTLLLTSLDIDFNQRYYTQDADFSANNTYGATNLTAAPPVTGYTGFTATDPSAFDNPAHAVSSVGTGSSYDVKIAHNSNALYMFELRNPSAIVPEPNTTSLAVIGAFALFGLVRRRKASTYSLR